MSMATAITILLLLYLSFNCIYSSCSVSSVTLPNQHILQSAYIPSLSTAYTFGAVDTTNNNGVYKFVSSSHSFVQVGTTPTSSFYSYANGVAIFDHLVYFIGVDRVNGRVHIFDGNTDSWLDNSNIASPPASAKDACISANETHIFSVGGGGDALQIYDIAKNTWTQSTINISPITGQSFWGSMCWMVNNVLYVFGGSLGPGWATATSTIYKWQDSAGWSSIGTLPQDMTTVRAARHPLDNNIFIMGGFPTVSDEMYQFNVDSETITNTYHLVHAKDDFAADFVGETLYVWGSRQYPTQIEVCTGLVDITTSNPTNKPSVFPTEIPTKAPSKLPTTMPSDVPSQFPTKMPSKSPNKLHTEEPSKLFSEIPTKAHGSDEVQESTARSTEYDEEPISADTGDDSYLLYFGASVAVMVVLCICLICLVVFVYKNYYKPVVRVTVPDQKSMIGGEKVQKDTVRSMSIDDVPQTAAVQSKEEMNPGAVMNHGGAMEPGGAMNPGASNNTNDNMPVLDTPGEMETQTCVDCGAKETDMQEWDGFSYCAGCFASYQGEDGDGTDTDEDGMYGTFEDNIKTIQ
eukprot:190085_1